MPIDSIFVETLNEMMEARGFPQLQEKADFYFAERKDEKILVVSKVFEKLTKDEVNTCFKYLTNENASVGIIICEKINPGANSQIKVLSDVHNIIIETFEPSELFFNITKHVLTPLHVKMDRKDAKEFKTKYGVKNLAIIHELDPICRFYGFRSGDVISIHRENPVDPTLPKFIFHRIVK